MISHHNLCGLALKINSKPPTPEEKVPPCLQITQMAQD